MKTLFLFRHAKSSWSNASLRDFERPLNGRGRKAAFAMGAYMANQGLKPDQILSSSAQRTRETYARFIEGYGEELPVEFRDDLYHSSSTTMLGLAKNASADIHSLMLIAHNPGMHDAALRLIRKSRPEDMTRLDYNFPTSALAVFTFDVQDWQDMAFGTGTLDKLVFPKDL